MTVSQLNVDGFQFTCEEHSYWIGVVTLGFVYLPALNIASGLFGTKTAGQLGFISGMIMIIVGSVILPGIYIWKLDVMPLYQCILMWLSLFLGIAYIALGLLLSRKALNMSLCIQINHEPQILNCL